MVEWKEKVEKFWPSTYKLKETDDDFSPSSSHKLSKNTYVANLQTKELTRGIKDDLPDTSSSRLWKTSKTLALDGLKAGSKNYILT